MRFILRRNPIRAAEVAASRLARIETIEALAGHPKADDFKALQKVWDKEGRLKLGDLVETTAKDLVITVEVDQDYLKEIAELDGCYCLKTDLSAAEATKEKVHDRYKDLAEVESAFRTCKTGHLELRPIFVRKEKKTRGHAFIVMLAYLLRRKLAAAWRDLDLTAAEGLKQLSTLCAIENEMAGQTAFLTVPAPRDNLARLFEALEITPPTTLPRRKML